MLSSTDFWIREGASLRDVDRQLARLGRGVARLRLRLGEALERLAATNGHHELGFSSFEAYVLERCERGARWARESRCVARRLCGGEGVSPEEGVGLRRIRAKLVEGSMLWSMAELLARHATADDEAELVGAVESRTIRQMREFFRERASEAAKSVRGGGLHSPGRDRKEAAGTPTWAGPDGATWGDDGRATAAVMTTMASEPGTTRR